LMLALGLRRLGLWRLEKSGENLLLEHQTKHAKKDRENG